MICKCGNGKMIFELLVLIESSSKALKVMIRITERVRCATQLKYHSSSER
jgi:hypothetical protein